MLDHAGQPMTAASAAAVAAYEDFLDAYGRFSPTVPSPRQRRKRRPSTAARWTPCASSARAFSREQPEQQRLLLL